MRLNTLLRPPAGGEPPPPSPTTAGSGARSQSVDHIVPALRWSAIIVLRTSLSCSCLAGAPVTRSSARCTYCVNDGGSGWLLDAPAPAAPAPALLPTEMNCCCCCWPPPPPCWPAEMRAAAATAAWRAASTCVASRFFAATAPDAGTMLAGLMLDGLPVPAVRQAGGGALFQRLGLDGVVLLPEAAAAAAEDACVEGDGPGGGALLGG